MYFHDLAARVSFLAQKSVVIWLSFWAVRYKAGWDYRLSATAKAVRWGVVAAGYVLAASLPGPGFVRLVPFLVGICFLCWPNLAYHVTNLFVEWPSTEARVVSIAHSESDCVVGYAFELGGQTFGGTTRIKASGQHMDYSEGQGVTVFYDPLNPGESNMIARSLRGEPR